MIEGDERTTRILAGRLARTDPDPGDAPVDTMAGWFRSQAADADHGIIVPGSNAPHAAVNTETATWVRISDMCALVDEGSHSEFKRQRSLYGLRSDATCMHSVFGSVACCA